MEVKYHDAFPWRLENGDTVCHFECREHLQKYLDRYKLKAKKCNITHKDGEPFEPRKKHKKDVESSTRKNNNRSTGSVRKRRTRMDSIGDTTRNAKGEKCLRKSKTSKRS